MWNTETNQLMKYLQNGTNTFIMSCLLSLGENYIFLGLSDGLTKWKNIENDEVIQTFGEKNGFYARCLALSITNDYIFVGSDDGTIRTYPIVRGEEIEVE